MSIVKENIRMYGVHDFLIIGEFIEVIDGIVNLKRPFRIIPNGDGKITVGAIFLKEEWIKFHVSVGIELPVQPSLIDTYETYVSKVFGDIILTSNLNLSI